MSSKMAEKPLLEQKKILLRHLPYVESKLQRLKGTIYESKWQDFKDHIVLDSKVLSLKRINELDKFFIDLKSRIPTPKTRTSTLKTSDDDGRTNVPNESSLQQNKVDAEIREESSDNSKDAELHPKFQVHTHASVLENKSVVVDTHFSIAKNVVSNVLPVESICNESRVKPEAVGFETDFELPVSFFKNKSVEFESTSSVGGAEMTMNSTEVVGNEDGLSNGANSILSNLNSAEDDKALEKQEKVAGSENLLKIQDLTVKKIGNDKTIGRKSTSSKSKRSHNKTKKDQIPTIDEENVSKSTMSVKESTTEINSKKEAPKLLSKKRKLTELDRLQQSISEFYDCNEILQRSCQPRACTKTKKMDEMLLEKYEIRDCYVRLEKLPEKEVHIVTYNLAGQSIATPKAKKMKIETRKETVAIKREQITPDKELLYEKENTKARQKSNPKKRLRSSWSKGFIRRQKRAKLDISEEWIDIDEAVEPSVVYTMKVTKFNNGMNWIANNYDVKKVQRDKPKRPPVTKMEDGEGLLVEIKTVEPKTKPTRKNSIKVVKEALRKPSIPAAIDTSIVKKEKEQTSIVMQKVSEEKSVPKDVSSTAILSNKTDSSVSKSASLKLVPTSFLPGDISKTYPKLTCNVSAKDPLPRSPKSVQPSKDDIPFSPFSFKSSSSSIQSEIPKAAQDPKLIKNSLTSIPNAIVRPYNSLTVKIVKPLNSETVPVKVSTQSLPKTTPTLEHVTKKQDEKETIVTKHHKVTTSLVVQHDHTAPMIISNVVSLNKSQFYENSDSKKKEPIPSTSKVIPQAAVSPLVQQPSMRVSVPNDVVDSNEDILRPWMKNPEFLCKKNATTCAKMINKTCLTALYKCMATSCCFFTDDRDLFQVHLELHYKHQLADILNCFMCAYCPTKFTSAIELSKHIETAHRFDKFSCAYCFYRTCHEYQLVLNHLPKFHPKEQKTIIVIGSASAKSIKDDMNYIRASLGKNVSPFVCNYPNCNERYYVLDLYGEHLQTHKKNVETKCLKCQNKCDATNIFDHYFSCYGYGMFQCVFCPFGTSTLQIIDDHLTNFHPNRQPFFGERLLSSTSKMNKKNQNLSTLETLTIKVMSKKVTTNCVRITVQDKRELCNAWNVGCITN